MWTDNQPWSKMNSAQEEKEGKAILETQPPSPQNKQMDQQQTGQVPFPPT